MPVLCRHLALSVLACALLAGCVQEPPVAYTFVPGYGYVPTGTVFTANGAVLPPGAGGATPASPPVEAPAPQQGSPAPPAAGSVTSGTGTVNETVVYGGGYTGYVGYPYYPYYPYGYVSPVVPSVAVGIGVGGWGWGGGGWRGPGWGGGWHGGPGPGWGGGGWH